MFNAAVTYIYAFTLNKLIQTYTKFLYLIIIIVEAAAPMILRSCCSSSSMVHHAMSCLVSLLDFPGFKLRKSGCKRVLISPFALIPPWYMHFLHPFHLL